jgi:hypothetical protein
MSPSTSFNLDSLSGFKNSRSKDYHNTTGPSGRMNRMSMGSLSFDSPRCVSSSPRRTYITNPNNKIIKHVDYVNGIINRNRVAGSFINRPVLNLNRPELNLDHRVHLAWSPTNRKSYFTTSKLFNGGDRKDVFNRAHKLDDLLRNDNNHHGQNEIEYFQRGMCNF